MEFLEALDLFDRRTGTGRQGQTGQTQSHFGGGARLPGVAAVEDHVFHLVAAEALGALLAEYPRDGIGHIALAAAIGTDDGRHALVEGQLRPV